eukprot:g42082.t1
MVPALVLIQLFVPVLCLCILGVMFYKCLIDLRRHRDSRPWMVRLFMSRQILIATCILVCLVLIAMVVWSLLTTTVKLVVCTSLAQVLCFLCSVAFFTLYCFLLARLQTVGLFRSSSRSTKCEIRILKCLDIFISGMVSCYIALPFLSLAASSGTIYPVHQLLICSANLETWFTNIGFVLDVLFGSLLTGGFCVQVYRASKSVRPDRDTQRWKIYKRLLRRSLVASTSITLLLAFILFAGGGRTNASAPFVFVPIFYTILCSVTIYCLRMPRPAASRNTSSLQPPPPRAGARPGAPIRGDTTGALGSQSSAPSLREDPSQVVPNSGLPFKEVKLSNFTNGRKGSEQTNGREAEQSAVGSEASHSFAQPGAQYSCSVLEQPAVNEEARGSRVSEEGNDPAMSTTAGRGAGDLSVQEGEGRLRREATPPQSTTEIVEPSSTMWQCLRGRIHVVRTQVFPWRWGGSQASAVSDLDDHDEIQAAPTPLA